MKKVLAAALWLALCMQATADERRGAARDSELYREVAALDTAVFDAFNRCDLDTLGAYFAEDVEFYHDKDGLSRGRKPSSLRSRTTSAER